MSYKDLRTYIDQLEKAGELQRIKTEVDWDGEIGAILRQVFKRNGPACLFENVKGSSIPLFSGAMFGPKKYGLMIDVEPDTRSIVKRVIESIAAPIGPLMVADAPCQENIVTGDDIDLSIFPSPKWHPQDGGRYIGTMGCTVSKDPESGIRNVAIYRGMIEGRNKVGLNCEQHSGIHLRKNRDCGRSTPVATCIGVPPAVLPAAIANIPYGTDEFGVAGALAGRPIPLVKCKTVDLEVPADSEIVLEGYIPADSAAWELEGPFGEFHGHYNELEARKRPTVILTAVTFRANPIFQGCSPGVGPNERTYAGQIAYTAANWQSLIKAGIPGVKDVNVTEMGCGGFVCLVSLSKHFYKGNAQAVMYHLFSIGHLPKIVVVVDDDIDIYDPGMVEWAIASRVQPHRDVLITGPNTWGCPIDPSIPLKDRPMPYSTSSRMGIDATKYFKEDTEFSPLIVDDDVIVAKILRRWKEYGFD